MAATISNFITALYSPEELLSTLANIVAERDGAGNIIVSRTKHFADAVVWLGEKRYLLSLPLSVEVVDSAELTAVRLRSLRSNILLRYELLTDELIYFDSRGRQRRAALLLEEIPKGELLSECFDECDAELLFAAIDNLEGELVRLGLSHSNLKAENIIISEDYTLYPLRMHYAKVGGEATDDFKALRILVSSRLGVECSFEKSSVEVGDSQNVMYGYRNLGNPFEGMCVAENHIGYGYVDTRGHELIAPQFIWAGDMREGRAEVETAQGMGLIDAKGHYIIEPRYQIVEFDPITGLSRVKENDKWTTFDYEGRPLE